MANLRARYRRSTMELGTTSVPADREETREARSYAGEAIDGRLDAGTVSSAEAVLHGTASHRRRLARLLPFLGPAFIACIAYVDPGNFATNIEAGKEYGYLLVWVIVVSNLMAMLIQSLSAKLGIATGKNLPEVIGATYSRRKVIGFWIVAEIVAMSTDLAEFLGAAIGFHLVFDIPMLLSGIITGVATFLILALQQYGFRPLEAVIAIFVGVIAVCYLFESLLGKPDLQAVAASFTPPRFDGPESVVLAAGILGATVMPHVIYLHSALTQDRVVARNDEQRRRLFRYERIDIVIAMGIAGLVNVAMLLMAAVTFHGTGVVSADDDVILRAYETLTPILGGGASTIFGISLIAAGLSSSTVGTMAGQVIMRGFLGWQIPLWIRRGITMLPALIVIALNVDATRTLVISQVVLSFGIPFALIPLVLFTQRKDLMGTLVNRRLTTATAWCVAAVIVALNLFLLEQTFFA